MKILITDRLGANHYIAKGWANVFNSLGHQVGIWDTTKIPAFDVFQHVEPDIFLTSSWQLDRPQIKNIAKRPNLKVLLSLSNWGTTDKDLDPKDTHIASEEERKNVEELVRLAPHVKLGFCQYADKYVGETHNHWRNVGIEPFGLLLGADTFEFPLTEPSPTYSSDLFLVSGYWSQKGENLQKFIVSLCYPNTLLDIKIFGNGWSIPQSYGFIPDYLIKHYYASALICPNIHEPQAVRSGIDVNQRSYQIFSCGGFQVSQRVRSMEADIFTNNEVVFVDTPQEFANTIAYFKEYPEERLPFIKKGVDTVYKEHTFLHRVGEMLARLGLDKESSEAFEKAERNYLEVKEKL